MFQGQWEQCRYIRPGGNLHGHGIGLGAEEAKHLLWFWGGGVNVLLWIPVKVGSSLPGSQEGAPAVSRGSQWPRQRDLYPVMGGPPLMAPRSKDHSKEPRCLGATEWSLHISFWQLSLAMSKVHLCAGEGWCHPGRLYTFQRICVHMCMHFRMEWSPSCVISHMGLCTLIMSDLWTWSFTTT